MGEEEGEGLENSLNQPNAYSNPQVAVFGEFMSQSVFFSHTRFVSRVLNVMT